ncbi:MAG: hypothetical protein ACJ74I_15415 [Gaiellaceae bacterium]
MKRIAALAFAAAALAGPAAQAHAATNAGPTARQFSALQKQVKALQAHVKALQKFVPTKCTAKTCFSVLALSNLAAFTYEVAICQQAAIADEFQATWKQVDQLAVDVGRPATYFGPQTSISDAGACTSLKITRPATIPPTVSIFSSFVSLLTT